MAQTVARRTRLLAQAGVIAAVHAAATVAVLQMPAQLGWGPVQLRLSEALTAVALFTPAAVPGLALGTALGNASMVAQVGVAGLLDVVAGSLATLIGAWWTWRFRSRTVLALAGPVLANALVVPIYLPVMLAAVGLGNVPLFGVDPRDGWLVVYAAGVVTIGVGQALVVYGLGWPLATLVRRVGFDATLGGMDDA